MIDDVPHEVDALVTRCSIALAARYLGCSRRHVEKLIRAGELDAWSVGLGKTRECRVVSVPSVRKILRERHLKAFLEGRKAPAPAVAQVRRGRD